MIAVPPKQFHGPDAAVFGFQEPFTNFPNHVAKPVALSPSLIAQSTRCCRDGANASVLGRFRGQAGGVVNTASVLKNSLPAVKASNPCEVELFDNEQ